jgi:hypothetical protein
MIIIILCLQWQLYLAAIAMYTFDLNLIIPDSKPEDNFYHRLNIALRRREPSLMREGRAYMFYLMRGLESLPAFRFTGEALEGGYIWRGVNEQGRNRVLQEYTLMRQV